MSYSIMIMASFIPSHPSIKFIEKTIESLKYINMKENTKIILAHDYHTDKKYLEYLENLKIYIKNTQNISIVVRETHGHLTGNIRNAIQYIDTKYIFIIQHDLPFINEFNINNVILDMENNNELKHVRFNQRINIKKGYDSFNDLFGFILNCENYQYTRTPGWSDQNHICLVDYYKTIVLKECRDGKFPEYFLKNKSKTLEDHSKYGTYLFGPVNHKKMINHINGRKNTEIKM